MYMQVSKHAALHAFDTIVAYCNQYKLCCSDCIFFDKERQKANGIYDDRCPFYVNSLPIYWKRPKEGEPRVKQR